MFHILVSDHLHPEGWEVLHAAPEVELDGPYPDRASVLAAIEVADALIIRSSTQVDAELLAHAPWLRVVARAGALLDNVDIDEATRRGILVINVPDANVVAVAEHVLAMLLALARGIPQGYTSLRDGRWDRHQMLGIQLKDKTLGIIGYGRHGREVAARAQAFGLRVLAYDPYIDESFAREHGVGIVPLPELLARADIISLHAAVTPETAHILNADAFALMREGVRIVNCTHAGLIDEAALLDALQSGKVAGAALDTLAQEPPPADHPLIHHPNVIAVPHLNQNTIESQRSTSRRAAEQVLDALRGDDYRNVVNLPFGPGAEYRVYRPYLKLAEKLGKLQGQLAEGRIDQVEIEVQGDGLQALVRPIAVGLLSGMLKPYPAGARAVNYVSAPVIAHEQGIQMRQVVGLELVDYPNLILCRVHWPGGSQTVAGVLFAGGEARLVQFGDIRVDAKPEGYLLFLENHDVPGVIGRVGTLLGAHGVNIGEWRLGRDRPGGRAVSFINLDSACPRDVLDKLRQLPDVQVAKLVKL
ncbi:MAG TPA: phosphoglycerate dehydrogenase [Anaerolineae bacterium]|nr:phosphoglycerate dehydrogenase [Anaerolineae bacterium]